MGTMIGAIFVIAMVILAAALIYFVVRGVGVAAETAEERIDEARAEAHLPEPGVDATPPATGLMMEEIPSEENTEPERARRESS